MEFPDAEEALKNMENLILADDIINEANLALQNEQWDTVFELYNKALLFDPYGYSKSIFEGFDSLIQAIALIDSLSNQPDDKKEQENKIYKITELLKKAETIPGIANTKLFKKYRKIYIQYQGKGFKEIILSFLNRIIA